MLCWMHFAYSEKNLTFSIFSSKHKVLVFAFWTASLRQTLYFIGILLFSSPNGTCGNICLSYRTSSLTFNSGWIIRNLLIEAVAKIKIITKVIKCFVKWRYCVLLVADDAYAMFAVDHRRKSTQQLSTKVASSLVIVSKNGSFLTDSDRRNPTFSTIQEKSVEHHTVITNIGRCSSDVTTFTTMRFHSLIGAQQLFVLFITLPRNLLESYIINCIL